VCAFSSPFCGSMSEGQLRSAPLKPSFALDDFGKDVLWSEAVSEVAEKRAQLCRQVPIRQHRADEAGGRLLLFVPSETLMDGAAKYSSNGFFDVNNVPPWDIWVAFSEQTLVSWVPPMLLELAQKGIDVNPEGCIRWAD